MNLLGIGIRTVTAVALLVATANAQGAKPLKKCAPDAVVVGATCMDKYEASVWRVPNPTTTSKALVTKIQTGKASALLLLAFGATQLGIGSSDYSPCSPLLGGAQCTDVFAVSLPGVTPSALLSWFTAAQACKNARKRLPTNGEWQDAAAGTPDTMPDDNSTTCNIDSVHQRVTTGSRSACVSSAGAFDMVGNVEEMVAEWIPRSSGCFSGPWALGASDDWNCLDGAATTGEPGMLVRGGEYTSASHAGPLSVQGHNDLNGGNAYRGFRCAR